jgi:hypothetical protein
MTIPEPQEKPLPSLPKSSLRHNPPPQDQQVQRMRSNQRLRPLSMLSTRTTSPVSIVEGGWEPPPLNQAYSQAIKYATVQACVYTPDLLLRTQSQRRQTELLREKMNNRRDLAETLEDVPENAKLEKAHRRLISNSVLGSGPQLTNKIYVLLTSGYVLQYADDGPFDRLPEKALKLGNDSAAFACDLIPGKHWVLQISQSANEDGIVSTSSRHSIFSRLRPQSTTAKKSGTSFLLVMESAEEMETWMNTVRREIENSGGMKASEESGRGSASIDEAAEKTTATPLTQNLAPQDPRRMSKVDPVDSPLQSQYSNSPKIVTSEWEGDRSEKSLSISDSISVRSRYSTSRSSVDAPSTRVRTSHEQLQQDQSRERNRHSHMSAATSVSGTGTRSTSRNSSPAPISPLKEGFSSAETEPLRSATHLRSFHMSPGNTMTRRRSMQPLPVTNEDGSLSATTFPTAQRHSTLGPPSHSISEVEKRDSYVQGSTPRNVDPPATLPPNNRSYGSLGPPQSRPPHNPNLVRYSTRSSSAPPSRMSAIVSPPPNQLAPNNAATLSNHSERRISASPKPFLRPLPVRPQTHNTDGPISVPRRFSSMTPLPARLPLGVIVNRSVTAPAQTLSTAANVRRQSVQSNTLQNPPPANQPLRRPNSMQIRSNPAPFLSSSRPVYVAPSTPSFVPGQGASMSPTSPTRASSITPVLRGQGQQLTPPKNVTPRHSMPAIVLPPPAPPPNMPLPATPPTPSRTVAA